MLFCDFFIKYESKEYSGVSVKNVIIPSNFGNFFRGYSSFILTKVLKSFFDTYFTVSIFSRFIGLDSNYLQFSYLSISTEKKLDLGSQILWKLTFLEKQVYAFEGGMFIETKFYSFLASHISKYFTLRKTSKWLQIYRKKL